MISQKQYAEHLALGEYKPTDLVSVSEATFYDPTDGEIIRGLVYDFHPVIGKYAEWHNKRMYRWELIRPIGTFRGHPFYQTLAWVAEELAEHRHFQWEETLRAWRK